MTRGGGGGKGVWFGHSITGTVLGGTAWHHVSDSWSMQLVSFLRLTAESSTFNVHRWGSGVGVRKPIVERNRVPGKSRAVGWRASIFVLIASDQFPTLLALPCTFTPHLSKIRMEMIRQRRHAAGLVLCALSMLT